MDLIVRSATERDWPFINDLAHKEYWCIGFIPEKGYRHAICCSQEDLLVVEDNKDLTGFIMASYHGLNAKIFQVAVRNDARRWERATYLVAYVIGQAQKRNNKSITAICAEDLEANYFWSAMNFIAIGIKQGGVKRKRMLIIYEHCLWPSLDLSQEMRGIDGREGAT